MQGVEWRRVEIVLHEKGVHVYKTGRERCSEIGKRTEKKKKKTKGGNERVGHKRNEGERGRKERDIRAPTTE